LTPITSTVSPCFGMPARRKPSIAVTKGTPIPAASSHDRIFRLLHHGIGLDGQMRGVGAVAPDPEIARRAEHLAADGAGRAVDHDPGVVAAGRARKYRVGHQAGRGLDVGGIDRRRLDLDQHFIDGPRQPARSIAGASEAASSALADRRTQRASAVTG
jgi:hypothetical protein